MSFRTDDCRQNLAWWQEAVVYQIYPRSFADANGDGIGDLRGIVSKLDHLQWLGIGAIWISPIFCSPMKDFGYDVADYTNIDSIFGTLDDFRELLNACHHRGIRVILDYVINHTSNEHPWFVESRSSKSSAKRDWYVWRDPAADGGPPNNWVSHFGGPAWQFDMATGQYYYHAFLAEQPDLNWRNPEVQRGMYDVLRFWYDLGVDGFRVDAISFLFEDADFRDNPRNSMWQFHEGPYKQLIPAFTSELPEIHDVARMLRKVSSEYHPERLLIGEMYVPLEQLVLYYGTAEMPGFQLPFNFQLLSIEWDAVQIRKAVEKYESLLPFHGWPNYVLGNHDNHRLASRLGVPQARIAAMLLLTLRGTPTLYYGDEIGMLDVEITGADVRDPFEINCPGLGLGRDPARTPMQWDDSPNGGFAQAGVQPWLPLAPSYVVSNVVDEKANSSSLLNLYRQLIRLRQSESALLRGSFSSIDCGIAAVFAFQRSEDSGVVVVLLNFSAEACAVSCPGLADGRILCSTFLDSEGAAVSNPVHLRADEGIIVKVSRSCVAPSVLV
jgi:alpha-glucosidase